MARKSCHELKTTQRVLRWTNDRRKELNLKPLKTLKKGYRRDASCCPIANSLSTKTYRAKVTGSVQVFDRETYEEWMKRFNSASPPESVLETRYPKYVSNWIHVFDNGKYPELVAKK